MGLIEFDADEFRPQKLSQNEHLGGARLLWPSKEHLRPP